MNSSTVWPVTVTGTGAPAAASKDLKFLHERAPDALLNWLRMTSVLLGALSIFCVHRLGRVCCPAAPRVADLAGLLVACLPMWSSLHGLLNNDVLAATLPWTPALSAKDHASDALPSVTLVCGASKDSPKIICEE